MVEREPEPRPFFLAPLSSEHELTLRVREDGASQPIHAVTALPTSTPSLFRLCAAPKNMPPIFETVKVSRARVVRASLVSPWVRGQLIRKKILSRSRRSTLEAPGWTDTQSFLEAGVGWAGPVIG